MSSGARLVYRAGFIGTGATIDIKVCGFRPKEVRLLNTSGNCMAIWTEAMPDGAMQKTADTGTGTTDEAYVTGGNGITPLASGFRLGADADMNVAGETVFYTAEE